MRTCDETWAALDSGFKAFMDCLGQLTEEELTSAPATGKWTVKDVVAHVWSWLDEANQTVRAWQGARPWQVGVVYDDAWNEAQVASRNTLPLITVVDGITSAHRRLMHQLDVAEEEALTQIGKASWGEKMPLVDFFYGIAEHYTAHISDLQAYQKHCLEGCD
jgi:hypothetical protein